MKRDEKAQLNMSFGMIFSIILIIVFIVFAFYAIKMVLDFQKSTDIGKFLNNFQNDVDKIWIDGGSQKYSYKLMDIVEEVCFDKEHLVSFKPFGVGGNFEDTKIKHLNLIEPFCVKNIEGKIEIRIKRDVGESLVTIEAEK